MKIESITVWTNTSTKTVMVHDDLKRPGGHGWVDPIGASYSQWQTMRNDQRVQLMLETAIDLMMQGYDLESMLTVFAGVDEFKALGRQGYPMCRALTKALVGKSLEPNTMTFDELLEHYS